MRITTGNFYLPADYSKRIKVLRDRFDLSQQQLARLLAVSLPLVKQWEQGRSPFTAAFNARFVERAYGLWPCDYAGACMVRVSQRQGQPPQPPKPTPGEPVPPPIHQPEPTYTPIPGVLVTEAKLTVSQSQDLNDQLSTLTKACIDAFGSEPVFSLRIEVHPKAQPKAGDIEKINEILEEVTQELRLG